MLANNDPCLLTLCKKIATHYDNTSSTVTVKNILAHLLAKFKFVSVFSFQWLTTELAFNELERSQIIALWQEKPAGIPKPIWYL